MSGHHTLFHKKMDWAKGRKEKKDAIKDPLLM
jgi:hypothetical protein